MLATSDIRSKIRNETVHEKHSSHLLDMEMTLKGVGRDVYGPHFWNGYPKVASPEVAWATARTKDNYLSAFYYRVARRRGKQKAIMALAHKALDILYHVLQKKPYTDLGAAYFDKLDTTRIQRHHVWRLEQRGYVVKLTPQDVA